ncbi:MAG: cyclic nucleotide-binding domain-containing protein [Desulfobulbaceae bacterium]|uniref:Cyclic nucleotide-binding domain-containing protein n=1 Tax=Candidatus Desulfatifera sulfidica TaxID=2841691 RepID=A0A8J6TCQ3_9BACT|nr:cyclic nucleotide-binding domain-containing protein [Candidatus Desulfatifera sulfidica]
MDTSTIFDHFQADHFQDQELFLENVERFEHGELQFLLDNAFVGSLAKYLSEIFVQGDQDQIYRLLNRLGESSQDHDGHVRERGVLTLSLFLEGIKKGSKNLPVVQQVMFVLVEWIRLETSDFPVVETVLQQLTDNCLQHLKSQRWEEAKSFLNVISLVQSGRLKKNNIVRALAGKTQEKLSDEEILASLLQAFLHNDDGQRAICEDLLISLGRPAGLYLVKMLLTSQDREHRFRLIGLIIAAGHAIVPILVECLDKNPPWYVIRNIVLIITALKDSSLIELVLPYLQHEDVRVQRQVIDCIQEIGDSRKREYLRQALRLVNDELRVFLIMQLAQPDDQDSIDSMLDMLTERDQFDQNVREDMLVKLCNGLRFAPQPRTVNLLNQLVDERLQSGGAEETDLVLAAARQTLHILQPQLRHYTRQANSENDGVSFDGDVEVLKKVRNELKALDNKINQLVKSKQTGRAINLIAERAILAARQKDFVTAELLTDKMYKVDPDALDELMQVGNIIEEEKSTAVTSHYIETWSALYELLGSDEFDALYSVQRAEQYQSDELIVRQGEIDSSLYFISSGQVRLTCNRGNREIFLKRLYPGDVIGTAPFFGISVWTVTLTALTPTGLQVLSRDGMQKIRGEFPELEERLYGYCRQNDRVPEWLRISGEERRDSPRNGTSIIIHNILLDNYESATKYQFKSRLVDLSTGGGSFLVRIADKDNARRLLGRKLRSEIPLGEADTVTVISTIVAVVFEKYGQRGYTVHIKFNQPFSENRVMDIIRQKKVASPAHKSALDVQEHKKRNYLTLSGK